jgi:hypothetical protein
MDNRSQVTWAFYPTLSLSWGEVKEAASSRPLVVHQWRFPP